ncbi:MAG: BamA/TamA family outer membrane protein [Bacteroidia bacterium]
MLNRKRILRIFFIASTLFLVVENSFAQQKSFIDKTLDWTYKIVQGDSAHPRTKYFFPIPFLSYKPETRWILGVSLTQLFRSKNGDSVTRPSALRLNTSYSMNKQFSIRAMGDVFTYKNKFNINGLVQYTDFVENYWGTGIKAPESANETYYFKIVRFNAKAAYQVIPNLYAGVLLNIENMYDLKYSGDSSKLKTSNIAGSQPGGSFSSGAGFGVEYDDMNNIFFPTKGQDIEFSACFYDAAFGSKFNFMAIKFNARKYLGLWKENVLALQLFTNMNSGNVPFHLLGTLGSDSYMRGYYNGRYRDNNAMAFQTELRKTVWGPLSIVVFGGFGTVSPDVAGLTTNLKLNYGGGLRIRAVPREKFNIRIDYGAGTDGNSAFYLTMGEAF